jgi:RNA polymerase sigma factor (sigma-70 family)
MQPLNRLHGALPVTGLELSRTYGHGAGKDHSVSLDFSCQSSDADEMKASIDDPRRFSPIVKRHFPEIFRYLSRRAGAVAEDLASETFVIAFRRRSSYDLTRPDARPWLYGIATNVRRHHRRSEMRQLAAYSRSLRLMDHAEPSGSSSEETAIVDGLDAAMSVAKLASAFSQLDDDQRDALYLVGVAGLEYQLAADALGLKLGTLKSRVARARVTLRDLLERGGQVLDTAQTSTMAREGRNT